jgi:hypothetical protein
MIVGRLNSSNPLDKITKDDRGRHESGLSLSLIMLVKKKEAYMTQNTVVIIVAAAVGAGVISAIGYYIARFMRGSIALSLPKTCYNPGDTITGIFDLHTKKALQGNKLVVRLIGVQITRTHENGKSRTRTREIYRDEVLVEKSKTYTAGSKATYSFEIAAPNYGGQKNINSAAGQVLATAFTLLSDRSTKLKWKVEARLDAKGVDLAKAVSVSINTGNRI